MRRVWVAVGRSALLVRISFVGDRLCSCEAVRSTADGGPWSDARFGDVLDELVYGVSTTWKRTQTTIVVSSTSKPCDDQ